MNVTSAEHHAPEHHGNWRHRRCRRDICLSSSQRTLQEDMSTSPPRPSSRHTAMKPAFKHLTPTIIEFVLWSASPLHASASEFDGRTSIEHVHDLLVLTRPPPGGPSPFGDMGASSLLAAGVAMTAAAIFIATHSCFRVRVDCRVRPEVFRQCNASFKLFFTLCQTLHGWLLLTLKSL